MIYLDNAATSWPKPPEVLAAMREFLEKAGGNPGRSGHRLSIAAGREVYEAREALAELFNAPDPLRVILTSNGTHAINLALRGLLRPGDRVVTTGVEHNAVMRPLRALESTGVTVSVVPCDSKGFLDLEAMEKALRDQTRLVVVNHASNVTGTILPVTEIAAMARRNGARLLVDGAQSAGVIPVDVQSLGIDLFAFTGHKGLQGPPGTGGLILGSDLEGREIEPLLCGGTGSRSEFEVQPEDLPDRFESGTPNGPGIAGLGAGVRFLLQRGVESIRAAEMKAARMLMEGLRAIPGTKVYGPDDSSLRTSTVSFTIESKRVSEVGLRLDEEHGVLCRVGLHCSPATHRTIETFPEGTVRFTPGVFTTRDEVRAAIRAVEQIVEK